MAAELILERHPWVWFKDVSYGYMGHRELRSCSFPSPHLLHAAEPSFASQAVLCGWGKDDPLSVCHLPAIRDEHLRLSVLPWGLCLLAVLLLVVTSITVSHLVSAVRPHIPAQCQGLTSWELSTSSSGLENMVMLSPCSQKTPGHFPGLWQLCWRQNFGNCGVLGWQSWLPICWELLSFEFLE